MCIGNTFAVLCKEFIPNKTEIKNIVESLEKSNGQSGHSGHSSKSLENFAEKSPSPEPIQL